MAPKYDEDHLSLPARPICIVIGCVMMGGGCFMAAVASHNWLKVVGLLAIVTSPLVMLTPHKKDNE